MVKTTVPSFTGFPKEGVSFLRSLAGNNNREWFQAHRGEYEEFVLTPALGFVDALGTKLGKLVPGVKGEPRVGGSLFRINRDLRFARGQGPYKTHLGMRIRHQDSATSRCTGPLFYVELEPRRFRIGVGVKAFDPPTLAAYRELVRTAGSARAIRAALDRAEQDRRYVIGEMLKRLPAGYEEGPTGDLLRRKGLFIMEERSVLPREVRQEAFVGFCLEWFKPYIPFFKALQSVMP